MFKELLSFNNYEELFNNFKSNKIIILSKLYDNNKNDFYMNIKTIENPISTPGILYNNDLLFIKNKIYLVKLELDIINPDTEMFIFIGNNGNNLIDKQIIMKNESNKYEINFTLKKTIKTSFGLLFSQVKKTDNINLYSIKIYENIIDIEII